MPDFFDEQDYKRRLIEGGLDADSAAVTARYTAEARNQSGTKGGHSLFTVPENSLNQESIQSTESSFMASWTAQKSAESAKLAEELKRTPPQRTVVGGMADKLAELAETQRRNIMATGKSGRAKTASEQLAAKTNDAKQSAVLKQAKVQIKELQLSLFDLAPWANDMRAMPNDLARAALFTTRNKRTPRAVRERHNVFHVNKDVEITYTGIELRADDDELVWQQVLEYAKNTPIGTPVSFTFYNLCNDVGWHRNGYYYNRAEACLSRLQATAIQFSSARLGRLESVSLIHRFRVLDRGKKNSRCQIEIDDEMVVLFAGDHYSKFIWEKYRTLSPTARRLFDYFASHREPFPLKLETFRLMCGSESARIKKWREQTGQACDELNKSGLVNETWVQGDAVYCKR